MEATEASLGVDLEAIQIMVGSVGELGLLEYDQPRSEYEQPRS